MIVLRRAKLASRPERGVGAYFLAAAAAREEERVDNWAAADP